MARSTSSLSTLPSQPQWNVSLTLVEALGHAAARSPSTSTIKERSGCLNFFSSRTALRPVQLPSAPSSISVGRIAESSPKIGGSSTSALCPDPDSMSKWTLSPVQAAVALELVTRRPRVISALAPPARHFIVSRGGLHPLGL